MSTTRSPRRSTRRAGVARWSAAPRERPDANRSAFSIMVGCAVGRDEAEANDRLRAWQTVTVLDHPPQLVGTVEQVAAGAVSIQGRRRRPGDAPAPRARGRRNGGAPRRCRPSTRGLTGGVDMSSPPSTDRPVPKRHGTLVAGVDCSTQATKVLVVDSADGTVIAVRRGASRRCEDATAHERRTRGHGGARWAPHSHRPRWQGRSKPCRSPDSSTAWSRSTRQASLCGRPSSGTTSVRPSMLKRSSISSERWRGPSASVSFRLHR